MKYEYELIWYDKVYIDEEISLDLIREIVFGFNEDKYDFLILTSKPKVEDSSFLQACRPHTNGRLTIEVRFDYENGSFKQYRYQTDDKNKIIDYFKDYLINHEIPNLVNWEDMTDELARW